MLTPHLRDVALPRLTPLADAGAMVDQVYFLEAGMASVVTRGRDGTEVEVGIVGREGVTPVSALLGAETYPNDIYMQISGAASAMAAATLTGLVRANQGLREALSRYTMAFLVQATTTVIANVNSPVEQRLARWLLMCHDRLEGDVIEITHDFLAIMLNVRRASVTVSLHVLEGMHAIRSTRGVVTVLDRDLLMELAGEAYGQAEAEYRKLVGPFPVP